MSSDAPLTPEERRLRAITRRHFFRQCGVGLGSIAMSSLLTRELGARQAAGAALQTLHHAPRAKNVIFLFMAGGPSQLDMFDYKPKLVELSGQVVPPSFTEGKRFAFIGNDAKLLGSPRKFARHGESGAEISELLPHTAGIADELLIIRSMQTEQINHGPAKLFANSGSPLYGRPSMGAWITYGIGSENQDLPGFVVMQSGSRGPRIGAPLWTNGFLPSRFQGVPFRNGRDPILHLSSPPGHDEESQRRFVETVNDLNRERLAEHADDEIEARIAAYELAFRMQSSAPELMQVQDESQHMLDLYGVEPGRPSFAMNCLLARRMVERGVRFVQLYHTDWDHHGAPGFDLGQPLEDICTEIDRPCAALITDLKQRGLLDDTLVVWGGEFGRTPMAEVRVATGRDHHIDAYSMWLAGGGVRAGTTLGATDDIGYNIVEDPVHVHDLHATMLHLLGIDHLRLTWLSQGRDFRLTDVGGNVIEKMLG